MDGAQIAALSTVALGVAGSLGGAGRFIWNKIERRFAAIDVELAHCRERERCDQERRAVQLSVIEILWQELERVAPGSIVLRRAEKLLESLRAKMKDKEG